MSSSTTHAIIGGVAGLALLRLAPELVPSALDQLAGGPGLVRDLAVLALTALLATWPDIEEPGSWIAQRVRGVCVLLGLGLGTLVGLAGSSAGLLWVAMGALGGTLVGLLVGMLIPRLVRLAAGGHRRLTHSLVFAAALAGAALLLPQVGLAALAVVPAALALGVLLHIPGDLVTPAGLPLLYPLSDRPIRLLPRPLAHLGESLILAATFAAGVLLLRS